ncbi:hypothetical protein SAMN05216390_104126 [Lachnospiraceae bacterium KH1T2]|nr:hypothetical protein SAMN05216390_104126 [Lachnospiraceae bacterium KH1T2]
MDTRDNKDLVVLCAASQYDRKYYLNPAFGKLPQAVKDQLQIACVVFTEQAGGTIEILFDEDGEMLIQTNGEAMDINYDEIGAGLLVKELRKEKAELFEELTLFYRIVFLGEKLDLD